MHPFPDCTSPADVPTAATHRFVRSALSQAQGSITSDRRRVRVLEIGCGSGALAARLAADRCDVLALDSATDAVRRARASGVDARLAEWPAYEAEATARGFDAVLFTRSLHHIHALGPALDRAADVLAPRGVVIVEDFAFAEVDRKTAAWFFGELATLDARGVITRQADEFAVRLLEGGGAFDLWHSDSDHAITPATELRAALVARFEMLAEDDEPYLYRYVCPLLPDDASGARIAAELYERERAASVDGEIVLIGRRFVAQDRKPSSGL